MFFFDFSRYLSYTSYIEVTRITLRDFASLVLQEMNGSSMAGKDISSGFIYVLTGTDSDLIFSTVKKIFNHSVIADTDDFYSGYINTPIKTGNSEKDDVQTYKFFGQAAKGSGQAIISLALPVTEEAQPEKGFFPQGNPVPGYVVKADSEGNPVWSKDAGVDPTGAPVKGYVVKINNDGIPEWLPDEGGGSSDDGVLKILMVLFLIIRKLMRKLSITLLNKKRF